MLPELAWSLGAEDLARIAAQVFANAPASEVSLHQLHVPLVDLRAQAGGRARPVAGVAGRRFDDVRGIDA